MMPADPGRVVPDIYVIKDSFVNFYLVAAGDKYVAIDAGNDPGNIEKEMHRLDIDPDTVEAVFLTHTDADHVKGVNLFKNAKIYISKEEEKMFSGNDKRFIFFKNKLNRSYETLEDGRVISVSGVDIKGLLIPGHTTGSMAYLVNGRYLFTGDTLELVSGKAGIFLKKHSVDPEAHDRSMRRLAALKGVEYVFTGHHGYSDDFETVFADWNKD